MINLLGTIALYGTPYLFVKAGLRVIDRHGISTTKNREHPWKVPPAELVLLAAAVVGWVAIVSLVGAYGHATDITVPAGPTFQANFAPPFTGDLT